MSKQDGGPRRASTRLDTATWGVLLFLAATTATTAAGCGDAPSGTAPATGAAPGASPPTTGAAASSTPGATKAKAPSKKQAPPPVPGPVFLLNPTFEDREESGVRLEPFERREATPADLQALGFAQKPGTEIVRVIGAAANFTLTRYTYSAGGWDTGPPPQVRQRWSDASLVEHDSARWCFRFDEEVPQVLMLPADTGSEYRDKLTWVPAIEPPPEAAWTDAMRYSLLSSGRFDLEPADRMKFRPRAYSTLNQVQDERFGPLLLAWLMGHGEPFDGMARSRETLGVLMRFTPALSSSLLDDEEIALKALEVQKKHVRADLRGHLAATFAARGQMGRARALIPEGGNDRATFYNALAGASRETVFHFFHDFGTLDERSQENLVTSLFHAAGVTSEQEFAVLETHAREKNRVSERIRGGWNQEMIKKTPELAPGTAGAMTAILLEHGNNDRFPTAYLWQAGAKYWGEVEKLWPRLSEHTREAALKEMLAKDVPLDAKTPFLELGIADDKPRPAKAALEWLAAHPDGVGDELGAKARHRAAQAGISSSLKRKIEAAWPAE